MNDARTEGLVARQWKNYPQAHRNPRNLVVHVLTVPLFMAGTLALPLGLFWTPLASAAGFCSMLIAIGAQGRMHRHELGAPAPFKSPLEAAVRIFAEQWITFPRFVLSGGFARALRGTDEVTSR
jgi:hypothetical protein